VQRAKPRHIQAWKQATLERWHELARTTTYEGPCAARVNAALRQLRLLVFEPTGAIVAAPTGGLPEVIGGQRNYDYRYSWLRDTAMIVRALLRSAARSSEAEHFLNFVARSREHARNPPLDAVVTVDARPVPEESNPPLVGYEGSAPVRIGNRAGSQLQLDALGNFLIAAGLIYRERGRRPHWEVTQAIADFVASRWREPDSGIWESPTRRPYTSSKVFAACGLQAVAPFADVRRGARYQETADEIRGYVMGRCLTAEGAFATFEGAHGVDISAALFPIWSFCAPDAPQMQATVRALQRDYERDRLLRRDDRTPQSGREGAFLPGTFWMAHYWACRGDADQARAYIDAGLAQANDLGLLPEEVDWQSGRALGNIPLGMTHASFLNAVADLAALETGSGPEHDPEKWYRFSEKDHAQT
jgi:GH15 family glucan-1,4-alpha-glucosidase